MVSEKDRERERDRKEREGEGGREGPIQRVTKNIICVSFSLTYSLNLSFLKVLAMVLRNGFDSVFCKDLKWFPLKWYLLYYDHIYSVNTYILSI